MTGKTAGAALGNDHAGFAEHIAQKCSVTRAEQDRFSAQSHQRAVSAWERGAFSAEVVPVTVGAGAKAKQVTRDEGMRPDTTVESLAKLRTSFKEGGTVTAGNASMISDGAAALVVASAEAAQRVGAKPAARIVAYATSGIAPKDIFLAPVGAVRALYSSDLERARHTAQLLGVRLGLAPVVDEIHTILQKSGVAVPQISYAIVTDPKLPLTQMRIMFSVRCDYARFKQLLRAFESSTRWMAFFSSAGAARSAALAGNVLARTTKAARVHEYVFRLDRRIMSSFRLVAIVRDSSPREWAQLPREQIPLRRLRSPRSWSSSRWQHPKSLQRFGARPLQPGYPRE